MNQLWQRSLLGVIVSLLVMATVHAKESGGYQIGPGDVLKIIVFQNPDLTLESRVSESGTISYPMLGQVKVNGLSTAGAEAELASRLREGGFVREPQVNVLVLQFRSRQVSVLGYVNKPGRYPLDQTGMRVSEVIALAGGITPSGADVVVLVSEREGRSVRYEIDLARMFIEGDLAKDMTVQANDLLYVQRAPLFYIYGEVQRPGAYSLEMDMTVAQALAKGGGLTAKGTERRLKLERKSKDGNIEELFPGLTDKVRADDLIYVRESLF